VRRSKQARNGGDEKSNKTSERVRERKKIGRERENVRENNNRFQEYKKNKKLGKIGYLRFPLFNL
jgi:hypothetical protein